MTSYKLNEEKMFADITDGIAIVINSETGIYYGMNGLGSNVFENLIKGVAVENIAAALKGIAGTPADIENRLKAFVDAAIEKELLISGQDSGASAEIDTKAATEDNFTMTVDEYNDAQELLLADPIHEVKEETGWTPEKDSIGYTKEETAEREKKMEE